MCVFSQDEFNNASGSLVNGKVHLEVINSCHVDEVPVLVGNTTRLQLALLHGRVTVQVRRRAGFYLLCCTAESLYRYVTGRHSCSLHPLSISPACALNGKWKSKVPVNDRLATAPKVGVFVDTRRTADAPLHHWRSRISSSGFTSMEQPAVERHLIDVIDCF